MKKLFITILCLLFSLPCFANNSLQKKDAQTLIQQSNIPKNRLMYCSVMASQDYNLYLKDYDAVTYYAWILKQKKLYCSKQDSSNLCNYLKMSDKKYVNLSNLKYWEITDETVAKFQKDKIIIENENYKTLDKEVKEIVNTVNCF